MADNDEFEIELDMRQWWKSENVWYLGDMTYWMQMEDVIADSTSMQASKYTQ